jgi:Chaperone of endosialidase
MSKQTINIGSAANDGTGDPLRTAFQKCNGNFDELYVGIDLSGYAPLASPTFTGDPKAPTPTAGDNDTSIATTAFVVTKAGNYLPLAGGTLTGNLTISSAGALVVQSVTASSSPTTGALTIPNGGLGVGGAINAGGGLVGASLTLPSANAAIELGAFGTSNTPFIDFHSSTTSNDYDVRLIASGGTSANGHGQLNINSDVVSLTGTTPSSSPTTGALTVAGGAGINEHLSVNSGITVEYGAAYNLIMNGPTSSWGLAASGSSQELFINQLVAPAATIVKFSASVASSSPTTGALTVAGGLGVSGSIYVGVGGFKPAGGPWSDSSDVRIKTVVSDYEHGLAEVLALTPKRYTYKGNDTTDPTTASKLPYEDSPHYSVAIAGTEYIGLIAQEVEGVMPEMVTLATGYIDGKNKVNDLRTLDTGALIYALINSIKELHARVQALEGAVI